jgi:hypothetical protein
MPKAQIKKYVVVDAGAYDATIAKTGLSDVKTGKDGSQYQYYEMFLKLDTVPNAEIKYGVPFSISPGSGLGQTMAKFGFNKWDDAEADPDDYLVNRRVKVLLSKEQQTGKNGTFDVNRVKDLSPLVTSKKQK